MKTLAATLGLLNIRTLGLLNIGTRWEDEEEGKTRRLISEREGAAVADAHSSKKSHSLDRLKLDADEGPQERATVSVSP